MHRWAVQALGEGQILHSFSISMMQCSVHGLVEAEGFKLSAYYLASLLEPSPNWANVAIVIPRCLQRNSLTLCRQAVCWQVKEWC